MSNILTNRVLENRAFSHQIGYDLGLFSKNCLNLKFGFSKSEKVKNDSFDKTLIVWNGRSNDVSDASQNFTKICIVRRSKNR